MANSAQRELYVQLVESHARDLFGFAFRLCGRREAAEDLVQETYQEAWRSLSRLREPQRARAWLFQILRHRFSHMLRATSRRPRVTDDADELPYASSPDFAVSLAQRDALQCALDSLDERQRVPLLMVFVEGLTCQEVADELGIPLGTVLSRVHRGRAALKDQLTEPTDLPVLLRALEGTS